MPISLEGPTFGAINLANAKGQVIGSITLRGDSWSQFTFQERRSRIAYGDVPHGRIIATGTGNLTFPDGAPLLSSSGSGPTETVPFKITI